MGTIASLTYAVIFAISGNYVFLVIGAIFEGLERALFSGNNEALLYDTLKDNNLESEYKTYLGKTNSMYQVAGVVGALIGGIVAYLTSFTLIMWLSVIPKVINIFISFALSEPNSNTNKIESNPYEHLKETIKGIRNNKTLVKQIFADSISDGVGEASYQFRAKFYEMVWPLWAIGIPSVLSNIGLFFSNWFGGSIIKKYGNKKTIIVGYIYSVISNVVGFMMNNVWSPLIIVTNSLIPTEIAKNDISNKLYTNKHRASMASIKSLFSSITYALFALIIGFSADNIGIVNTLIFAALFKIIVIAIYINIFKRKY